MGGYGDGREGAGRAPCNTDPPRPASFPPTPPLSPRHPAPPLTTLLGGWSNAALSTASVNAPGPCAPPPLTHTTHTSHLAGGVVERRFQHSISECPRPRSINSVPRGIVVKLGCCAFHHVLDGILQGWVPGGGCQEPICNLGAQQGVGEVGGRGGVERGSGQGGDCVGGGAAGLVAMCPPPPPTPPPPTHLRLPPKPPQHRALQREEHGFPPRHKRVFWSDQAPHGLDAPRVSVCTHGSVCGVWGGWVGGGWGGRGGDAC